MRTSGKEGMARRGFTLIELMIVVAIMAVVLAMGVPSFQQALRKEGFRKTLSDIQDVCQNTRAQAITNGAPADMVFNLRDRTVAGGGSRATIEDSTDIRMLDINLTEYKDSESAKVRFFPNGTCDEMTLVLCSRRNEWRKLSLEITTGLLSISDKLEQE
jgi:type II secretion system protein H